MHTNSKKMGSMGYTDAFMHTFLHIAIIIKKEVWPWESGAKMGGIEGYLGGVKEKKWGYGEWCNSISIKIYHNKVKLEA